MAEKTQFHVDQMFEALGSKGRYQALQFFLTIISIFPANYQLLDNVFIGRDIPHRCARPTNDSESIPWESDDVFNNTIDYQQCTIDLISNSSTVSSSQDCQFGMEYDYAVSRSVKSEFDLVCSHDPLFRLTQTLVFAGQGVGALFGTMISDRHGRKLVLVSSNLSLLVIGIVLAFAPNYTVFAIFKFAAGAFQQGVYVCMAIYLVELFPAENRRLAALSGGSAWGVASITLSLIAYLFRDGSWRYLQLCLSLSSLSAFAQLWLLDESIRWSVANGKTEQGLASIKRAARMNKKIFEEIIQAGYSKDPLLLCHESNSGTEECSNGNSIQLSEKNFKESVVPETQSIFHSKTAKMTLLDLLKVKSLFRNTMVMLFAWFTCSLCYFTIYLTASSLSGDIYLNYFLHSAGDIPASLAFYIGFNTIGRKASTISLFATLGSALFAVGLFKHFSNHAGDAFDTLTLISSLVAIIGAGGSFHCVFFYLPELVPTNLRNQVVGLASCMARVGALVAPFTGVLADKAIWAPGLLMGCCSTVVTLLLMLLPETKGKELPQTLAELRRWQDKAKGTSEVDTAPAIENGQPNTQGQSV